jgi:hypothetical protein
MKMSTLSISCVAMLSIMALAPAEAWAKPKRVAYTHDDWNLTGVVSGAYGGHKKPSYLPGGSIAPGGDFSFNGDLGGLYQLLTAGCQIGGTALSIGAMAGSAVLSVSGPVGWGIGGACLLQQIVGLGMPPPKPIVVKGKTQNVQVNIDLNDPRVQAEFRKMYPQLFRKEQEVPSPEQKPKGPASGTDVPTAQAPTRPGAADGPPVQLVKPPAPVAPASEPPKKMAPAKPGETQEAKATPAVTLLNPSPQRK